jgi:hypothetical protein
MSSRKGGSKRRPGPDEKSCFHTPDEFNVIAGKEAGTVEGGWAGHADLIAFPELSLTGYIVRDRAYELAESVPDGPSLQEIQDIAKNANLHIIYGMIEKSAKAQASYTTPQS